MFEVRILCVMFLVMSTSDEFAIEITGMLTGCPSPLAGLWRIVLFRMFSPSALRTHMALKWAL